MTLGSGELASAGTFRDRLRAGERLVGSVLTVPSVPLAELLSAPLDFVWIDLEHGALGTGDVQPLAIAARAADAAALVRLPAVDAPRVGAILDAGVDGIVAPGVDGPAQAQRLAARLRRPPLGTRGAATRRSSAYGRAPDLDPALLAQIESVAGLEQADEIAAVDGVDALIVGCADLAAALGEGTNLESEAVRAAIARVRLAATGAGIAFGIAGPGDPHLLLDLAGAESTLFVHSADVRMYARIVDSEVAELRRLLALHAPKQEVVVSVDD